MKKGLYTISLGCPKNLVDTEKILGRLSPYFAPAKHLQDSHVVLINTCAFIEEAISESIEEILCACEEAKHCFPPPSIVVTGCLVNRYSRELKKEIPEVDLWVPIKDQGKIVSLFIDKGIIPNHALPKGPLRILSTASSYAYLKIAEGCNHRCSFCVIPFIRGPLVSYPHSHIIEEARYILSQGRKELILVAQDLTSYGKEIGGKSNLIKLLYELASLKGLEWLRFLYLYPQGIDRSFLEFLKGISPPFVPYFDIPFQHSHPQILRAMGRPFKIDSKRLVGEIREIFPHAAIRTSIIVGFPGEQEKHFSHLIKWVEEMKFNHLGVFVYSDEEGSRAYLLEDKIDKETKQKRREQILKIQRGISQKYLSQFVGQNMEILIDRASPQWPTLFEGRTWFQAPEIDGKTYISGENIKEGDLVKAYIEQSLEYDLCALM